MTRDDIIRMAKEAGLTLSSFCRWSAYSDDLERFAALVADAARGDYFEGFEEGYKAGVKAEREKFAEESAELLQALQNLHQRCHWADAPEEMDAAKAAIGKAIRARGEP